jgi:hypothetical protein
LKKEANKYVKREEKRREKKEAKKRSQKESMDQKRRKRRDEDSEEEEERRKIRPPLFEECVFPCNSWLASDEGDGLVERELKAVSSDLRFSENYQGQWRGSQ